MAKAKPIIVLALIAAIISCLVIVVYQATYVDTSNVVTDKQAEALTTIYGGTKDDFSVVPAEKWQELFANSGVADLANVTKVFSKNDGSIAFESVVKGYKKGYDIMVGVKESKVAGVAVVSVGEETPGLGTKTNDPAFLDLFKGKSGTVEIVKNKSNPAENEVNGVTSATYSSRGVALAVNTALSAYDLWTTNGGEAA